MPCPIPLNVSLGVLLACQVPRDHRPTFLYQITQPLLRPILGLCLFCVLPTPTNLPALVVINRHGPQDDLGILAWWCPPRVTQEYPFAQDRGTFRLLILTLILDERRNLLRPPNVASLEKARCQVQQARHHGKVLL